MKFILNQLANFHEFAKREPTASESVEAAAWVAVVLMILAVIFTDGLL